MYTDLLVLEGRGVDVALDLVSFRVDDDRTGQRLGERTLDAAALQDPGRFGENGPVVRGHGSLRIPMSVGALEGSVAAPAISGFIVVLLWLLREPRPGLSAGDRSVGRPDRANHQEALFAELGKAHQQGLPRRPAPLPPGRGEAEDHRVPQRRDLSETHPRRAGPEPA